MGLKGRADVARERGTRGASAKRVQNFLSSDVEVRRKQSADAFLSLFLVPPLNRFSLKMASRPVLEAFEAKRIALEVKRWKMGSLLDGERVERRAEDIRIDAHIKKTTNKKSNSPSPPTPAATRVSPARSPSGAYSRPWTCFVTTGRSTRTSSSRSR